MRPPKLLNDRQLELLEHKIEDRLGYDSGEVSLLTDALEAVRSHRAIMRDVEKAKASEEVATRQTASLRAEVMRLETELVRLRNELRARGGDG